VKKAASNRPRRVRIDKATRDQVYRTYGSCCWLCSQEISYGERSVDHVKPVSHGGTDLLGNLRPAHLRCNSVRRVPHPVNGRYLSPVSPTARGRG
jgi:5-methylcytosine-specific restriction endonuclease McrA